MIPTFGFHNMLDTLRHLFFPYLWWHKTVELGEWEAKGWLFTEKMAICGSKNTQPMLTSSIQRKGLKVTAEQTCPLGPYNSCMGSSSGFE